jgi:outer membrane protein assembly factor BamB
MKLFPGASMLVCVSVAALIGPRAAEAQSLLWKLKTNDSVISTPALGPDGTVYVGSADNNIYAITSAGGLKWKFSTNGFAFSSPALGPDGTRTWGLSTTTSTQSRRRAA